jgi:3-(3-hydroxy-phenyl)propionate hydroxylase
MPRFVSTPFPYRKPVELSGALSPHHPVIIIGAGPVGLAAAIDLALHGIKSLVLDDNNVVSVGSRAICWSKRSLEIFDRLGVGRRMLDKGVTWQVGRLFHGKKEVYAFDLLPEPGHRMPAFVNLQQYYVEHYLVERCADFPDLIDLRWKNKVIGLVQEGDHVHLTVETPDGIYNPTADWVIACDGARSPTRDLLGLSFAGHVFEERFLIADIEMKADFPSERWFWFDPPFHSGQSALLHKQPDNIYRIDLQLGWDSDPEEEKKPEKVIPRIKAMVGERVFELDWVSVYTFQCRRLERFIHGRVIFAGDSAHVVSPFGARGGNGGIQDVDNLCWKLAAILKGQASRELLMSYDEERMHAADENIRNSSRATHFMTPGNATERHLRHAALALAENHAFARRFINSGRLSVPACYSGLHLQSPAAGAGPLKPGSACPDAPVQEQDGTSLFLLDRLGGRFQLLVIGDGPVPESADLPVLRIGKAGLVDAQSLAAQRYGEGVFLIRPDQHVAACLGWPGKHDVQVALLRASAALAVEA